MKVEDCRHTLFTLQQHITLKNYFCVLPPFNNPDLLTIALTHKSYVNENLSKDGVIQNNERLEFLGDAIVNFITAEWLFAQFPNISEGRLTSLRAALIRAGTLAQFALKIGLPEMLRLGKGEMDSGGRLRANILCDAFEAVLAALYLDQGIDAVRHFFVPMLETLTPTLFNENLDRDPKTRLQEWSQSTLSITPRYRLTSTEGPDHAKQFTIEVWLGNYRAASGHGNSKQIAEQMAAQEAMNKANELYEDIITARQASISIT